MIKSGYSYTNKLMRDLVASESGIAATINKEIDYIAYGKPQQFNTEAELYKSITGHESKHIK